LIYVEDHVGQTFPCTSYQAILSCS